MRLLCLDTSTRALSVALVVGGAGAPPVTAAAHDEEVGVRHGEELAPAVRRVLDAAAAAGHPRGYDAVAVGVGPGPFTSLRVGIATAAALADAAGVPAYPACSLDLLAAPDRWVVQDARRKEVYWAAYGPDGARADGPGVLAPADLAPRLPAGAEVVGAGAEQYAAVLGLAPGGRPLFPPAAALWGLVGEAALAGEPGGPLTPLYLRAPDAAVYDPAAPRRAVR